MSFATIIIAAVVIVAAVVAVWAVTNIARGGNR